MLPFFDIHSHQPTRTSAAISLFNVSADFTRLPDDRFISAGIHPWYLQAATAEKELKNLKQAANQSNVVAIGECGLDKVCETDFELQTQYFRLQLELAKETNKPVIIHCVRAFEEVIQLLQYAGTTAPIIFHGFNKNQQIADRILSSGYYLSFGKHLADDKIKAVFRQCPINRIFLETDNSQLPISTIYQLASATKGIDTDLLCREITNNVRSVFGDRIFTAYE